MIDDEAFLFHELTLTFELPGGWEINTIAMHAVLTMLDHLEHDGLRPQRVTMDIVERSTP